MYMNEGVEWAAHCTAILAALPLGTALPAARLAEYHGIPAPYLAKSLQALTRAGIVESTTGRNGGYRLGRAASEITLLDIVQAIEGKEPLFRCTEIRRRGPSRVAARSYTPTCGIAAAMGRAEQAWKEELQATTVAALADLTMKQAPRVALEKGVTWITQVLAARNPAPRRTMPA
jgi:Rrf2 family protein